MDGFVKLTPDDVVWYTDKDGEPQWKPKHPEPGKSYCLVLPKVDGNAFSTKPLLKSLRESSEGQITKG
jgi:hypothetical protein